ncbi:uncharacterized protein LOC141617629 [Silene latifolia]|uniref:uncharacterized protein LOC141617629 n=1 Tax=Silene latifolia TaxID=37657 RepID=UPI003D76D47E
MSLFYCDKSAVTRTVKIEEEDVLDEIKFLQNTVMGNFLGSKPKIQQVDEFVLKNWNNVDRPIVQYYKKGWYSFSFLSEEDMNEVLKGGPWTMGSGNLILKKWSPTFTQEMDSVLIVPVWVLFPDLDTFMWSDKVLTKLASVVGKPLFADLPTIYKSKLSFVRVMVEVDVAGALPTTITLTSPYHGETSQRVIYELLPYYCHCCRKMGHTKEKCKFIRINNNIDGIKTKKVVQEYQLVQINDTHTQVGQDSRSHVLGHSSSKLGDESSVEVAALSSEYMGLGSSVVSEKHSPPNEKEEVSK